jgi:hypothetical protein
MNIRHISIRFLAAVITVLLASCIDSREEFWIEADGGGRAQITCTIPAAAARIHGGDDGIRKLIADFLRATPSIKRSSHEVTTANGRTTAVVEFAFDSALDLMETSTRESPAGLLPPAAKHFLGEMQAEWRGRSLEMTRRISPGKSLPGAAFMPASTLEGRLVTIMHLPAPASASNATRTENSGRTLVWETPFAEAVKSPVTYHFIMDAPLPWKLIGGIVAPLALLGGVLWIRRIRVRTAA